MLINYIRRKKVSLALFACWGVVYSGSLWLYRVQTEVILYPLLLCMLVGLLFFIMGYLRYRRNCIIVNNIVDNPEAIVKTLENTRGIVQEEGLNLIKALDLDRRDKITKADWKAKEQQEYFTLWTHQIKTPISAMDLLMQSGETDIAEYRKQLFKIEEYVGVALQYLRVDSLSGDLALYTYELDYLIRQALHKYADLFISKNLQLVYEPVSCFVVTDEKWMVFVLEQLLSNALKYTKKGAIRVYLKPASLDAQDNGSTVLCIEDTGIGIAAEDLPRVFENGFTGFNGRLDKKSTGIGLYLCHKIVKKLGHGIAIQSQPNVGTTVCLDFGNQQDLTKL